MQENNLTKHNPILEKKTTHQIRNRSDLSQPDIGHLCKQTDDIICNSE